MKSVMPTNDCLTVDSKSALYLPAQTLRSRFLLRAEKGYLYASHKPEGPPIEVCANPEFATRFVDHTTAVRRAFALQQLGWRNLRIVELRLPA